MGWFVAPLKRYAVFRGRSRRKEYWLFALFCLVVLLILSAADRATGTFDASTGVGLLTGVFYLVILVPTIAVSVRRLHDTDRTGWWALLSFVPVIGTIVLLVFAVLPGTRGSNRFGPDPRSAVA